MPEDERNVIGFILKGYPRLSETFIVNEILLLEQLGHQLHIFALRNPGEEHEHDSVRRVRAKVTYIPDYFWTFFFSFVSTNLRLLWRRPKLYWQPFRFALLRSLRRRSSSTIKRFVQAAYLVERSLPGTHVSYFHAHFSHGPTTVAFFASWLTNLKYSFSAHAKDIYLQEPHFLTQKIKGAQFVVTCTEFNRRHLLRVVGGQAPVFCVYHGIDLQRFYPPRSAQRIDSRPVILAIGRLVPKKGFPVLLQALRLLRDKTLQFQCYLIGGGEMKRELAEQVSNLRLRDCTELLPPMSQSELLTYYRQADLFVLPCEVQKNGDRDGIPNVLVEAMAMEIPVVSTSISGIPELVDDGVNGCLVAEKSPTVLADGISDLLRQSEKARRFARAGRAKIECDFDAKKNVARIAELLSTALEGRPLSKIDSALKKTNYAERVP